MKARDQSDDPLQFFKDVQTRIQEEETRSEAVLPVGSWGRVRKVTEASLLDNRAEWLAQSSKSRQFAPTYLVLTCYTLQHWDRS